MAQRGQPSFDAMRQDAIRRSREMHRRAMPAPPVAPPVQPPPPPPDSPPKPPGPPPPIPPKPPKPPMGELSDLLGSLHLSEELRGLLTDWDGEKLALAGILYLLYKEGADPALLLAIGYILL